MESELVWVPGLPAKHVDPERDWGSIPPLSAKWLYSSTDRTLDYESRDIGSNPIRVTIMLLWWNRLDTLHLKCSGQECPSRFESGQEYKGVRSTRTLGVWWNW
jgi:hypothetical protein